jgi:hypothetical protein
MLLVFQRTGQRRYGIQVKRPPFPDVEMTPAPGYDQLMPHDMLHLVVEAKLGLTRGIFGQLAEGGDAGTFHLSINKQTTRELSRARNRLRTRGKKLLREGREDSERSERAAYICWYEWRNRSSVDKQRSQARSMVTQATGVKGVAGKQELRNLSDRKIDEICEYLDELSSHWSRLEVGECMIVRWPDLAVLDTILPSMKDDLQGQ